MVENEHEVLNHNFNGFIKDALVNTLFISIEVNFRSVSRYLEASVDKLNKTSVRLTFEKFT